MLEELNDCEVPIEVVFDVADTSGQIRFLGLSQTPEAPDEDPDDELVGLFQWTCQACGATHQDRVMLKPQQMFSSQWTCNHCSRVTQVRFHARTVAEWIVQHTMAVAGRAMNAPTEDRPVSVCRAGHGKQSGYSRQRILVWVAVTALAVLVGMSALDMRRVSKSSAALQTSVTSVLFGTAQKKAQATPSDRIVGYWISEAQDHVMCFTPIDPPSREGAYAVVRRGGKQPDTVRFKVVHEDTAGEELVIRKGQAGSDKVTSQQKGTEVMGRQQSDSAEVTFNVAKDGKSMTRVEIRGGQPATTTYFNAGDSDEP